jgi:hypothetical protein
MVIAVAASNMDRVSGHGTKVHQGGILVKSPRVAVNPSTEVVVPLVVGRWSRRLNHRVRKAFDADYYLSSIFGESHGALESVSRTPLLVLEVPNDLGGFFLGQVT